MRQDGIVSSTFLPPYLYHKQKVPCDVLFVDVTILARKNRRKDVPPVSSRLGCLRVRLPVELIAGYLLIRRPFSEDARKIYPVLPRLSVVLHR